ncbi:hypothetical protein BN2537_749 [Streptomyces venezuelae]|nr:hypothetical protein BN2537_749 [Streptomyces venezuelae]
MPTQVTHLAHGTAPQPLRPTTTYGRSTASGRTWARRNSHPDKAYASRRNRAYLRRLRRHPAVAARYDKLAVGYEATVLVAARNRWL